MRKYVTFGEYIEFIRINVILPYSDIERIAIECWNNRMTKYEALDEARKLMVTERSTP